MPNMSDANTLIFTCPSCSHHIESAVSELKDKTRLSCPLPTCEKPIEFSLMEKAMVKWLSE